MQKPKFGNRDYVFWLLVISLLTSWELFLGVFIFCMESRYNNY